MRALSGQSGEGGAVVILTDERGIPFVKPERADYADTGEFLRAFYAYKDAIRECANRSFDKEFRKRPLTASQT